MNRRTRIQPKGAVELETVSLRLPPQLVRVADQLPKYLGGSTDRTPVITQVIEIAHEHDADFQEDYRRQGRRPRGRRRPSHRVAAVPTCLPNSLTPGGARPAPPAVPHYTVVFTPALSAIPGGPFRFPRQ